MILATQEKAAPMDQAWPIDDEIMAILARPTCSVEEFARIFDLSKNPAYDAVKRGDVPSIRMGRLIRLPTRPLRVKLGLEG